MTQWCYPTRFEDVLDVDPRSRPLLLDFVPRFRLLVDDLSAESDDQLRARAMTDLAATLDDVWGGPA